MRTNRRDVMADASAHVADAEGGLNRLYEMIDDLVDKVLDLEDELASLEQRNIELESIVEELNIQLAEVKG